MRHNFLKNFILNLIFAVCLLCKSVNGAALSENTYNELSNEQTPIILQRDKQLHFLVGASVSKAIFLSTSSMIAGFFIGSSVGAIKELLDKQGEGIAETNDFIATSFGALLILLIK
jgi:hypothetical protein